MPALQALYAENSLIRFINESVVASHCIHIYTCISRPRCATSGNISTAPSASELSLGLYHLQCKSDRHSKGASCCKVTKLERWNEKTLFSYLCAYRFLKFPCGTWNNKNIRKLIITAVVFRKKMDNLYKWTTLLWFYLYFFFFIYKWIYLQTTQYQSGKSLSRGVNFFSFFNFSTFFYCDGFKELHILFS